MRLNVNLLLGLFVGLLVISNVISAKLFVLGAIILPVASIVYVLTYPITDVISEVYGKKKAQEVIKIGFITQIAVLIVLMIAINLPPAPFFEMQTEYATILGAGIRVIFASLTAYVVSQFIDVHIFHKLKEKHGESKLWLRNNASTMTSQFIDTIIFITIAFYGVMPVSALIGLVITQYLFKVVIAIVDTPLVYLGVKLLKNEKSTTEKSA